VTVDYRFAGFHRGIAEDVRHVWISRRRMNHQACPVIGLTDLVANKQTSVETRIAPT